MSELSEIYQRMARNEQETALTAQQINTHEKICAERYLGIAKSHESLEGSIGRMQAWLLRFGVMLMAAMGGILAKLVFFS